MAEQEASGAVELIKLQSSEGEIFEVSMRVAKVSRTLSTMLSDLGHEPNDVIPLPNVNSSILRKVLGWADHIVREGLDSQQPHPPVTQPHSPISTATPTPSPPTTTPHTAAAAASNQMPFQPRPQPRVPQRPSPSRRLLPPPSHTLSSWEKEFLSRNKDNIYDLLLAANYLDIKSLLDVLCSVVADMIKGRDPQDIRKVFHAPNPSSGWAAAQADTPPPGSRDSNCSFSSAVSSAVSEHRQN